MRDEVGVGDQHPRRVGVSFKDAHRLAGLHQQGFILFQHLKGGHNSVVALPVARRAPDAAVNHQLVGIFRDIGIEIVHQHAQRRFGEPAFRIEGSSARGADLLLA